MFERLFRGSLGEEIVRIADRLLLEADNIHLAANQFSVSDCGVLQIATTHTQARYVLPDVILKFRKLYPGVRLVLRQMSPKEIAQALLSGEADLAIATDVLDDHEDILAFAYYSWSHVAVVAQGHPLDGRNGITLKDIAEYPVVTYDAGITGRERIDEAFDREGLAPEIVMTALDADVIKTYVELGLGIGIIAPMAFDQSRDSSLRTLHGIGPISANTTSIAVRRGRLHRGYVYRFLELAAPRLTEELVRQADEDATERVDRGSERTLEFTD